MKNIIIVTGGAGFVGSNLIQLLLKKTNKKIIGWEPKIKFKELVNLMVDADLKKIK